MELRSEVLKHFEDPNSPWRKEALENIEKYRKGDVKIKLVDKSGAPLTGAEVRLKQKSHEFKFGANIFMLDELETEEKNETYKRKFAELFNMATLPFYWCDTEPEKGKTRYKKDSPKLYRRPPVDLCLEFCEENGIEPREHALAYDYFYPKWLKGLTVDEEKREIEAHFREIAELYADRIKNIEVTNEMFWEEGQNVTSFYREPDFIKWCFDTARKYFPDNRLIINDWRYLDEYRDYLKENIEKGAPIDVVGIQHHFFYPIEREQTEGAKLYNPEYFIPQLAKFEELGLPIEISEVTVPAYSNSDEDEEIQARLIENLYTYWFSRPLFEKIVYWNLVDGYAAFAPQGDMTSGENKYYGALLRFDLSEKPAYKTLKKLIQETWHTEESLKTDENGETSFRGFYGDYEIAANGKIMDNPISVSKNGDNSFTVVC